MPQIWISLHFLLWFVFAHAFRNFIDFCDLIIKAYAVTVNHYGWSPDGPDFIGISGRRNSRQAFFSDWLYDKQNRWITCKYFFQTLHVKHFGNCVIAVFPKILKTVKKLVKTLKINKLWIWVGKLKLRPKGKSRQNAANKQTFEFEGNK